MFDVGASLAAARETRGYGLADAERLTNIRQKYLAALERADFDALPGRAYARAFLRTYASALGLEADRFVAAFEELVPEPEEESIALVPPPRRHRVGIATLVGLVVVGALAGVVWATSSPHGSRAQPPAAAATAPPRPAAGVLGTRHTDTPKPAVHATLPAASRALVVRATRGDCWLQVRRGDATGTVVYEGTLRQGGSLRFAGQGLWLRLGAPGMVDVTRGSRHIDGLSGLTPLDITA